MKSLLYHEWPDGADAELQAGHEAEEPYIPPLIFRWVDPATKAILLFAVLAFGTAVAIAIARPYLPGLDHWMAGQVAGGRP